MRVRNIRCCAAVAAALVVLRVLSSFPQSVRADDEPRNIKAGEIARGRELFTRVWRPRDVQSRLSKSGFPQRGDGLGPVYNDTSCAACHSQAGIGGAGPTEKNVQILVMRRTQGRFNPSGLHPGLLRDGSAVVLHRHSVFPGYDDWRKTRLDLADTVFETQLIGALLVAGVPDRMQDSSLILGIAERITAEIEARDRQPVNFKDQKFKEPPLFLTERNPPALFGAGLIDKISDRAIVDAAQDQQRRFPQIAGRSGTSARGELGRFGWQAQVADLREFTLTACAVELGLNLREHTQASDPQQPDVLPPGFDLSPGQCDDLVAFVASVPPPREVVLNKDADVVRAGSELFAQIGCAQCHPPELGGVKGIYSDLLLHNMGHQVAGDGCGGYGAFVARGKDDVDRTPHFVCMSGMDRSSPISARALEVRTPPLWGVASSAPYLHDGRAGTLADAIAIHAGQGSVAADAYAALNPSEQHALLTFLGSLVAPRETDVMPAWQPDDDPHATAFKPRKPKDAASAHRQRKKPAATTAAK